ncbi:hypothetical protein pb186bvf_019889 [Paramecium bursaria]
MKHLYISDSKFIPYNYRQLLAKKYPEFGNNSQQDENFYCIHFQFRIINLIYPEEEIIIKTTNKKYYKRFQIPDLRRLNLKFKKLIDHYPKPDQLLERQQQIRNEFNKFQQRIQKKVKQSVFNNDNHAQISYFLIIGTSSSCYYYF